MQLGLKGVVKADDFNYVYPLILQERYPCLSNAVDGFPLEHKRFNNLCQHPLLDP